VLRPVLSPADFEKKWLSLAVGCVVKDALARVPDVPGFTAALAAAHISVLASAPPQNGLVKYFMFAQEVKRGVLLRCLRLGVIFIDLSPVLQSTGPYHLIETTVDINGRVLTANIKSDNAAHAGDFALAFRGAVAKATM
jgi:hypothetical protein